MKKIFILVMVLLSTLWVAVWVNPAQEAWKEVSNGDDDAAIIALLGKPEAFAGDDTFFWFSSNARLTFPIFYRYFSFKSVECEDCKLTTYLVAEKKTAAVFFYFFEWVQ